MKILHIFFFALFSTLQINTFSASLPEIINIRQRPDSTGLYEKLEISFNLNADYINPFDPDEIDITADFTSPSGKKWLIHGFYDYSFGTLWKIRFSPDETDKWSYTISAHDKNGSATSGIQSFVAVKSNKNGPVQVAANKRYLKHSDGSEFYGIGLWYNDSYAEFNHGQVKGEELDYLKSLGINFIARWGYSRALAIWFIIDEVNGTDGWVSGDSIAASGWAKKVHTYFKTNDPFNHPTTGTRSGGINEFWHQGYQTFDLAAREIYEAQGFQVNKTG